MHAGGEEIGEHGFHSATPPQRFFCFGHVEDDTWPEREYLPQVFFKSTGYMCAVSTLLPFLFEISRLGQ